MVFGVAGPSDHILGCSVLLLSLLIIPISAFTFNFRCWADVGIPGALQRLSPFCGSARLAAELFDFSVQLIHDLVSGLVLLCLLLSNCVDPFVIIASHGVFEALALSSREGRPVAVFQGCPVGAGIVFGFGPCEDPSVTCALFFGLEFRQFACDV